MTEKEIIEGNKLIAEFIGATPDKTIFSKDGYKHDSYWHFEWVNQVKDNVETYVMSVSELKYHSSWDWLMPVVEKIELLGSQIFNDFGITSYSRFEIKHNHVKLYWSKDHKYQLFLEVIPKWMDNSSFGISKKQIRIDVTKETSKIEAVWIACIEFIKWYNENQNS